MMYYLLWMIPSLFPEIISLAQGRYILQQEPIDAAFSKDSKLAH